MSKMITKRTWKEFREDGMLFFANQYLQQFGYSLVFDIDKDTNEIKSVYPARTKFRGFSIENIEDGYKKLSKYLKNNIKDLCKEMEE